MLVDEDAGDDAPLRSKANPFQDVPHDKTACVVKQGFLQRKLHADIDGKRSECHANTDESRYLKAQSVVCTQILNVDVIC